MLINEFGRERQKIKEGSEIARGKNKESREKRKMKGKTNITYKVREKRKGMMMKEKQRGTCLLVRYRETISGNLK